MIAFIIFTLKNFQFRNYITNFSKTHKDYLNYNDAPYRRDNDSSSDIYSSPIQAYDTNFNFRNDRHPFNYFELSLTPDPSQTFKIKRFDNLLFGEVEGQFYQDADTKLSFYSKIKHEKEIFSSQVVRTLTGEYLEKKDINSNSININTNEQRHSSKQQSSQIYSMNKLTSDLQLILNIKNSLFLNFGIQDFDFYKTLDLPQYWKTGFIKVLANNIDTFSYVGLDTCIDTKDLSSPASVGALLNVKKSHVQMILKYAMERKEKLSSLSFAQNHDLDIPKIFENKLSFLLLYGINPNLKAFTEIYYTSLLNTNKTDYSIGVEYLLDFYTKVKTKLYNAESIDFSVTRSYSNSINLIFNCSLGYIESAKKLLNKNENGSNKMKFNYGFQVEFSDLKI